MINDTDSTAKKAAYIVAKRMFGIYFQALNCNPGLGPELFAENWMRSYLTESTQEFEDNVVQYFVTLLINKHKKKGV